MNAVLAGLPVRFAHATPRTNPAHRRAHECLMNTAVGHGEEAGDDFERREGGTESNRGCSCQATGPRSHTQNVREAQMKTPNRERSGVEWWWWSIALTHTTIPRKTTCLAREQGTTRTHWPRFTSSLCHAHFPATFPQATADLATHLIRSPALVVRPVAVALG